MIVINGVKAIEMVKGKIRAWREAEFHKNDLAIQNALLNGSDTTELIARRDYLRDLPATCEGKSLDELKVILEGLSNIKNIQNKEQ